jgi:hypothetical protein
MDKMDQPNVGNIEPEPAPHPGRDLPPPPIDEPLGDSAPDQPPVRDPPVRPEGNPPRIA